MPSATRAPPGRGAGSEGTVKHSMLIAWHVFTTGETYRDLGGDYFHRCDR
jgi:hypothetical protein